MEFDDQFYQNLFQLVMSPNRKEASAELLRIVNEVKDYYAANGIIELWRNAPSVSEQDAVPQNVKRVDKPFAPLKRETLQTEHDSVKGVKREIPDLSIIEPDSPPGGHENLKIVANLEEDDESVDVIQQSSDCVIKMEADSKIGVRRPDASSLRHTQTGDLLTTESSAPFDLDSSVIEDEAAYYHTPSPKIRRVALEQKSQQFGKGEKSCASKQEDRWTDEPTIACLVCKQLTFKPGNCLLECHECHTWFHQKCHEPNIPDTNDSRTLWYCSKCNKKIKKETATISSSTSEKSKLCSKDPSSNAKIDMANKQKEKDLKERQRQQFLEAAAKRVEHKPGSAPAAAAKPVALLAADFLAKHKNRPAAASALKSSLPAHSKTPFSTATSSTVAGGAGLVGLEKLSAIQHASLHAGVQTSKTTSVQAAEKRLQMMKKKAAGKALK